MREEQQKLKQETLRLQTEEIMKKQQEALEAKKREMDEKDQRRREVPFKGRLLMDCVGGSVGNAAAAG